MLAVNSLAFGKEVIISRGELIEIGGSFRLPDVIVSAGGILKEVGTTNRTRIADYHHAIGPSTGIIFKCHRSNFQITGFTQETSLNELVSLSRQCGIPVVEDLGSGAIVDLSELGMPYEPTAGSAIASGTDLVLFSGDKLLGGVQSGIIAGKETIVDLLFKNPMYRTLRPDKLIVATIESVLSEYLKPNPQDSIPALIMAAASESTLKSRTQSFVLRMNGRLDRLQLAVRPMNSTWGGGTLPGQTLPSWGVELSTKGLSRPISPDKLSALLRRACPPVIGLLCDETIALDFRTIPEVDEPDLCDSLSFADQELLP